MLLELTEKEIVTSSHRGHAAWLSSGLKIQEMQYEFGTFPSDIADHNCAKIGCLFKRW
jgi:TPP-dependent pyruvate/acetoin dehydrogenase alpha subunit